MNYSFINYRLVTQSVETVVYTCRHCLRTAVLWCPDCRNPYCCNCWGKVAHHDYVDAATLLVKMNKIEYLKYRDYHFDPMCIDGRGKLIPLQDVSDSKTYSGDEMAGDDFEYDIAFPGFGMSSSIHSASMSIPDVDGDESYRLAMGNRSVNRLKIKSKLPRKIIPIAPKPENKLTRKLVDMLSEQFDSNRKLHTSITFEGSLSNSSMTGVSMGILSKQSSQLSEQYLNPSVTMVKAPGEYAPTTPKSRGSGRPQEGLDGPRTTRSSRPNTRGINNTGGNSNDDGSLGLQNRAQTAEKGTILGTLVSEQGIYTGPGHSINLSRKKKHRKHKFPKELQENKVLIISPSKPPHSISQEAGTGGVSLAPNIVRTGSPPLMPNKGRNLPTMSDDDSIFSDNTKEFKIPLTDSNTNSNNNTTRNAHIIEHEQRMSALKSQEANMVQINGMVVRVAQGITAINVNSKMTKFQAKMAQQQQQMI